MVLDVKVSIITVCFNSADYIASAIDSVLSQNYSDIEYIVIDGGSTDETINIIRSYTGIDYFISEPDHGIYDAMNKGISLASGDVIAILNSDDFYLHQNVISQVVQLLVSNPHSQMVLAGVDFVSICDIDSPIREYHSINFSDWKMRFGCMPPHPASFIRRDAYSIVGNYHTCYTTGADFDWFVRALLVHKLNFIKLDRTLVRMRIGGATTNGIVSYWRSSLDIFHSLKSNGKYSCFLCILIRLPIKFFQKLFIYK